MTPEISRTTVQQLLASADQLRGVLEAIDSGALEASGRQRSFLAGALNVTEAVLSAETGVSRDGGGLTLESSSSRSAHSQKEDP